MKENVLSLERLRGLFYDVLAGKTPRARMSSSDSSRQLDIHMVGEDFYGSHKVALVMMIDNNIEYYNSGIHFDNFDSFLAQVNTILTTFNVLFNLDVVFRK